jgi:hypothetical protein
LTTKEGAMEERDVHERDELTTADLAGRDQETDGEQAGPLLEGDDSRRFHDRWQQIQTGFVDRPRESVEEADQLVADLMQRLAGQFAETRSNLERQWEGDHDVSTEDLRVALTRYRSFFERLLTA